MQQPFETISLKKKDMATTGKERAHRQPSAQEQAHRNEKAASKSPERTTTNTGTGTKKQHRNHQYTDDGSGNS